MASKNFNYLNILSFALHPLIIPTLVTAVLLFRPDLYLIVLPNALMLWFTLIVFVFTCAFPVLGILILNRFSPSHSTDISHRTERIIPLLIAGASFVALLFSMRENNIPPLFMFLLYAATFVLLAGLLIHIFYKISLYTLGWSALAAILISLSLRIGIPLLPYIIISVIISGFVGYIELKQNAHNQTQVYLGYVAGVLVTVLFSIFL